MSEHGRTLRFDLAADRVVGAPRRLALVGGGLFAASATFPWFTAGAIATQPFAGRALVALALGLLVIVSTLLVDRFQLAWQITVLGASTFGILLVTWSALAPPRALSPSTGVALATVGAALTGLALFAARWRHRWTAPEVANTDDESLDDAAPSDGAARHRSRGGRVAVTIGIVAALALGFVVLWPAPTPDLAAAPDATSTHAEALERFDEVTTGETGVVWEPCASRLLTHGERTDVAVVLFHGLTNCPKQFVEFGEQLFDQGANVVILRAPDHGRANAEGTGIGSVANVDDLSAEALRDYADDAIDIATGLGDEVRVLGLSMGGVIATWTAQERDDVDRVVAVAPAINIPYVPAVLTHVFRNVSHKLPNVSLPSAGAKLDHAYAGETTKGLDATFAMAAYVADSAYVDQPAADDVIVVLNPDDEQVDATHLAEFADAWASTGGPVTLYRFPGVGLRHDVIDLDQPDARPELVYPILLTLLDGDRP